MSRSSRVFRLVCRTALAAGCLSAAVAWPSSSQGASADAARQAARNAAAVARARKLADVLGIESQDRSLLLGTAALAEARGGPPFTPPGPPFTPPGPPQWVPPPHASPFKVKGNNGVGNGLDPQPPGNPPINDGAGTGPGNPGNR